MLGDKYIDKAGNIFYVRRGDRYPHTCIWNPDKRRYQYYVRKNGKWKELPIQRVHPTWLFWNPNGICKDPVKKL